MEVEIQAQHSEVHPRWRALVERRAEKLSGLCTDIQHVHVTLVHSTHHLRGDEAVRVLVTVPHETLKVHKAMANMGDAIHAAFEAMEHELRGAIDRRRDARRRRRRGEVRELAESAAHRSP